MSMPARMNQGIYYIRKQILPIINFTDLLNAQEDQMVPFHRNFNSILRRDYQKKSYERRAYESVDEKSLSKVMPRKHDEKKEFGP